MGLVEADVDEEGFSRILVGMVVEPTDGLVGQDLAGIAFDFPQGFAVADEIGGIVMGGDGIVASGDPVIVAVVTWIGSTGSFFKVVAEVPFSDVRGGIATGFEEFGDSGFFYPEVHLLGGGDPTVNPRPNRKPAGLEGCAGWGANSAGCIEVGKLDALGGEFVEVGSLVLGAAVAGEVAGTKVVSEHDDDVWLLG